MNYKVEKGKRKEPKLSKIEERLKKMETLFDTKRYVVLDNGTGFIKGGFSGQDLPRVSYTSPTNKDCFGITFYSAFFQQWLVHKL
jgi:hypothetical protein